MLYSNSLLSKAEPIFTKSYCFFWLYPLYYFFDFGDAAGYNCFKYWQCLQKWWIRKFSLCCRLKVSPCCICCCSLADKQIGSDPDWIGHLTNQCKSRYLHWIALWVDLFGGSPCELTFLHWIARATVIICSRFTPGMRIDSTRSAIYHWRTGDRSLWASLDENKVLQLIRS